MILRQTSMPVLVSRACTALLNAADPRKSMTCSQTGQDAICNHMVGLAPMRNLVILATHSAAHSNVCSASCAVHLQDSLLDRKHDPYSMQFRSRHANIWGVAGCCADTGQHCRSGVHDCSAEHLERLGYLVSACHKIVDPDGEILCLLKASSLPPMNDFQAQQLILAVNVFLVIVIHQRARVCFCLLSIT